MKQDRVLSMLGIAARGRNVVSGEFQTVNAVKDGSAMLVIIPGKGLLINAAFMKYPFGFTEPGKHWVRPLVRQNALLWQF